MFSRIAFVDLETSGLSPTRDRITEIGVILIDGTNVAEWSSLVHPGRDVLERRRLYSPSPAELAEAPLFDELAPTLYELLAGRLFVAHNARFDYQFLCAAFRRVGIRFEAPVVCSVMLSRQLYPAVGAHDLDSLRLRHGLTTDIRHRALPDARLLWQFWKAVGKEHRAEHMQHVIDKLLHGPVFPSDLDPAVIDRLPDAPGVFALKAESGDILHVGQAQNLRLRLIDYFRIDHASRRALDIAHRVRDIVWEETGGSIGAQLKLKALWRRTSPNRSGYAWLFEPAQQPCMTLAAWRPREQDECYGWFATERRAINALRRLAKQSGICSKLLGVHRPGDRCESCSATGTSACDRAATRLRHLTNTFTALRPWRNTPWPYPGAIGIREHTDLHVLDAWAYLGTARTESEVHELLHARRGDTDRSLYTYLARTLPRLPRWRIVPLDTEIQLRTYGNGRLGDAESP